MEWVSFFEKINGKTPARRVGRAGAGAGVLGNLIVEMVWRQPV